MGSFVACELHHHDLQAQIDKLRQLREAAEGIIVALHRCRHAFGDEVDGDQAREHGPCPERNAQQQRCIQSGDL